MSKALQIYYNAIFGAIGGLLGWLVVGSVSTDSWSIWLAYAFVGAGVGLFVGGMVGAVEGIIIKRSISRAILGTLAGGLAGLVSGLLGLLVGEAGFLLLGGGLIGRSLGWLLLGLFLGIGEGIVSRSRLRSSYGAIGGTIAGVIGGLVYESMTQAFLDRSSTVQMVVGALGLILIGACLGAIIPLTIYIVGARGTLRVLTGRREQLEIPIVDAVTLGSYDGCDVYLPGDQGIKAKHARVYRKGQQFFIENIKNGNEAEPETYIGNTQVPSGSALELQQGAQIRLGNTLLELV
jgi:hypothetical protein